MIARLFDRGVVLRMGTREIRANSTRGLRSDLTGHASVSAARIAELGKLPDVELLARAAGLAALTADLSDTLAHRDCDPAKVLAQMNDSKTPLDEIWASAITQVSEWSPARAAYQRALLDALVEYLASERDCVRILIENRRMVPLEHSETSLDDDEALAHQRLIFDVARDDNPNTAPIKFDRLTKDEPLEIQLAPGQCIQLMLAHHRFALICGSPWRLVDEYGEDLRVSPGRCIVGRSSECDLIVYDGFRAVSRRHVVLETSASGLLRITDISSLGTCVPRTYLDNRLH